MQPQENAAQTQPTTFASDFGTAGLSSAVRSLTKTMLDAWNHLPLGRRVPKDAKLASLRADVMIGHVKPVEHVLRLSFGAIDSGIASDRVTQWAKDYVTTVERYAARKAQRQALGILSFPQRFQRLFVRETREQGEADCMAIAAADGNDVTALRATRVELGDHIDALTALRDLVSERIVELESVR